MQFAVLNEAMTRDARKMEPFTGEDEYGNPVVRVEMQGCGKRYMPNIKDRETKKPYPAFPVGTRQC